MIFVMLLFVFLENIKPVKEKEIKVLIVNGVILLVAICLYIFQRQLSGFISTIIRMLGIDNGS